MSNKKTLDVVNGFLTRAFNKRQEANTHLKGSRYPESISASQECIEFSLKSVFLLLQGEYPRTHEFKEEQFGKLLEQIPKELRFYNFPRLFLLHKFWSMFYTVAKYGYEKLATPAIELFKREEAELALKHANECYNAAHALRWSK